MMPSVQAFALVKLIGRVLADYPLARQRLARHAGKTVQFDVGPMQNRLRITAGGEVEPVGEGADAAPDLNMRIPLSLLPRLAARDESAYGEVVFSGDSELAATLSTVVRNVKWDIEEDLSHLIGDVAAHRAVGTAQAMRDWTRDAGNRLNENVAEYLTEEKRLFITASDLESLARANETLRDDLARLEARLDKLSAHTNESR